MRRGEMDPADTLEKRVERLEEKIDYLIQLVEKAQQTHQRLERHITFIENTYEQLHTPLDLYERRCYEIIREKNVYAWSYF